MATAIRYTADLDMWVSDAGLAALTATRELPYVFFRPERPGSGSVGFANVDTKVGEMLLM